MFLFTDACFDVESKTGGIGAVLLTSRGEVIEWFASQWMVRSASGPPVRTRSKSSQMEAFPVLMAIDLWKERLSRRHLVAFVDKEGARLSIIRGRSPSLRLNGIVARICSLEEAHFVLAWYARVPSPSNVADAPSRDEPASCLKVSQRSQKAREKLHCLLLEK